MSSEFELLQLLSLDIPKTDKREIGFLEISGMAHYENVNSRIYAYFLDSSNHQSLSNVFLYALLELIYEKTSRSFEMENFNVLTEEPTSLGNRIDIALRNDIEKKAILIENKIYHILNNDLKDYWDHYKYDDLNKVGVLLTLYPYRDYEHSDKFINITHLEWIKKIKTIGLPSGIPDKFYTYLNDFFRTIEYLTNTSHMNEQTKFYFEHTQKILLAKQISDEANRFLVDQMEVLAHKLGWETYGSGIGWRNIWDKKNNLDTFYTIWYMPLINGEYKVFVIIELYREDLKQESHLHEMLKGDPLYDKMIRGYGERTFQQFATREYTLTISDIERLADKLFEIIQSDFKPVMDKILNQLYPKVKTDQI